MERLAMICSAEDIVVSDDLITEIAERADGGMRDAIMLLDQCVRAGVNDVAGFELMTGITDFGPGLVRAMLAGDYGRLFQLTDQLMGDVGDPALITARVVRCLRDVLVLKAGGPLACSGVALTARQELAVLSAERCVAALKIMWDLQKVRALDARASLDLAVIMCAEQLRPMASAAGFPQSNGHRKATMADIAAMGGASPGG
jgi:DNA polymerase III subunit gamma/tau